MQDAFEEHLGVVAALRDNYTEHDDTSTIASIAQVRDDIAELCSLREAEVMDIIKALSKSVDEAEVQATYPRDENIHPQAVASLENKTEHARQEVERLNEKLSGLQQQREALQEKFKELREKSAELEKLVTAAAPKTKHQLGLYAHISKTTFDTSDEQHVTGTVSDPETGDIHNFSFDPKTMSHFDIVNRIWDLIDSRG